MGSVPALISKNVGNTLTNYRTWNGILYNVLDNGLKGGGVVDDTAALQALINKAISEGRRTIFFPHGTNGQYYVTALTNADQVDFVGDNASFVRGYAGTITNLGGIAALEADIANVAVLAKNYNSLQEAVTHAISNGYGRVVVTDDCTVNIPILINNPIKIEGVGNPVITGDNIFDIANCSGVVITGLVFNGVTFSDTGKSHINIFGGATDVLIEKNTFKNGKVGISLYPGKPYTQIKNIMIRNNIFKNLYHKGVHSYIDGQTCDSINGVSIVDNWFDTIGLDVTNISDDRSACQLSASDSIIARNKIKDCTLAGISLLGDPTSQVNYANNILVSDNIIFSDSFDNAMPIRVRYTKNSVIANNIIRTSATNEMIVIWGTSHIKVTNNKINDLGAVQFGFDYSARKGITVYSNCDFTTVSDNLIENHPKPIYVMASKTVVKNNKMTSKDQIGSFYCYNSAGVIEFVEIIDNSFENTILTVQDTKSSIVKDNVFTYPPTLGSTAVLNMTGTVTNNYIGNNRILKPFTPLAGKATLRVQTSTATGIVLEGNDFGTFDNIHLQTVEKQRGNSWQYRATKPLLPSDGSFTLNHRVGDVVYNTNPSGDGNFAWVCISDYSVFKGIPYTP